MKTYELTYIVTPDLSSDELSSKTSEIQTAIQGREGVIVGQTNPVARTLSYPVSKKSSGFFGTLEFQLEPEKAVELNEMLTKDGKILTHMLLVKRPARQRKERRGRTRIITSETEQKIEQPALAESFSVAREEKVAAVKATTKEKVELKDIEEKLEELLGD